MTLMLSASFGSRLCENACDCLTFHLAIDLHPAKTPAGHTLSDAPPLRSSKRSLSFNRRKSQQTLAGYDHRLLAES